MAKLLEAFKTCNSLANARRLVKHVNRHHMVFCFLTADDEHILREAVDLVKREGQ